LVGEDHTLNPASIWHGHFERPASRRGSDWRDKCVTGQLIESTVRQHKRWPFARLFSTNARIKYYTNKVTSFREVFGASH